MKLLELIIYCRLKGLVKDHRTRRLTDDIRVPGMRGYRIRIQSRGYELTMYYQTYGNQATMFTNTMLDCKDNSHKHNLSEEEIVNCLLGPKA